VAVVREFLLLPMSEPLLAFQPIIMSPSPSAPSGNVWLLPDPVNMDAVTHAINLSGEVGAERECEDRSL